MAVRWIGWQRVVAPSPWGDGSLDYLQSKTLVVHAVREPHVGGYLDKGDGLAGRAACGTPVPADDPNKVAWWVFAGRECKRCRKKAPA